MRSIETAELKANLHRLLNHIRGTGEAVILTENGEPVARLGPVSRDQSSLAGLHEGQIEILGDIVGPPDLSCGAPSAGGECEIPSSAIDGAESPEEQDYGPPSEQGKAIWGLHQGLIEITGDIVSPIYSEWAKDLESSSTRTS